MSGFKFKNIAIAGILSCSLSFAGLPPTTSKVSGDSTNVTTFNYQFPNLTGTHTGTSISIPTFPLPTPTPSGDYLQADGTSWTAVSVSPTGLTNEVVRWDTCAGAASTATRLNKFTNFTADTTHISSHHDATNGDYVQVSVTGQYSIGYAYNANASDQMGIFINVSGSTTNPYTQTVAKTLCLGRTIADDAVGFCSYTGPLTALDKVFFGRGASGTGTTTAYCRVWASMTGAY